MFKKRVVTAFLVCSLLSFSANTSASILDGNSSVRWFLKVLGVAGAVAMGADFSLEALRVAQGGLSFKKPLVAPVIMAAYFFLKAHDGSKKV